VLGVLGGLNQGYTTYGIFLNARLLRLDAGIFAEEMWQVSGRQQKPQLLWPPECGVDEMNYKAEPILSSSKSKKMFAAGCTADGIILDSDACVFDFCLRKRKCVFWSRQKV